MSETATDLSWVRNLLDTARASVEKPVTSHILRTSREYAIYANTSRGIPLVHDGLKEVQRIALWLLRNRGEKIKTVALSGLMAYERLYVHGETSANDAIGLLAAPFRNTVPLIEGLGQFGSRVTPGKEGIGAPRYTDVKRSKVAEAILYADLDLVPMEDNYDGSNQKPKHFLPLIPTLLLNGISGVGVGWSTNILPRSLKGLVQATQDALQGKKALRGLEPHFQRYDVSVQALGPNQYEFTGKVEVEDTSTVRVRELPPNLSLEDFRERLIAMEDADQIVGFTDRSADAIDIAVRFKRGSIKGWSEDDAINFLKLRSKDTERIVVVNWDGETIRVYDSPEDVVREFAAWRLGWYEKRYQKLLRDTTWEREYWRAIAALFDDRFPTRLGKFENRATVEVDVTKVVKKAKVEIDDEQLGRIVSLPTYRWTQEFDADVRKKIAALDSDIALFNDILSSEEHRRTIFIHELDELKKLKV